MKKILSVLAIILLFAGCSDGDVKVQNISFENVAANSCGDIVYKINGNDAMLLIIPAAELAFKNEVRTKTKTIGGSIRVVYRNYAGVPTANNFCVSPPAATPNVIEEWEAIGGTIEITTTAVRTDPDPNTQATRINKYNHYIVFKNLNFKKPVGNQKYDSFVFGNYQTNTTLLFPNSGSQSFVTCTPTAPSPSRIYVNNNSESLVLDALDPALFVNAPNTTPIVKNLGATSNILTLKTYNGVLPASYYCAGTLPATPVVQDTWIASGGTIEVTTAVSSGTYTHSIRIKNAVFTKTGLYPETYFLGTDFNLGSLVR
jgi:hypothetical protein